MENGFPKCRRIQQHSHKSLLFVSDSNGHVGTCWFVDVWMVCMKAWSLKIFRIL